MCLKMPLLSVFKEKKDMAAILLNFQNKSHQKNLIENRQNFLKKPKFYLKSVKSKQKLPQIIHVWK